MRRNARFGETVLAAQKLALQKIRAGGSGAALQEEVAEFFRLQGYPAESSRWPLGRFFSRVGPRNSD